jgi:hypothetical protein
MVEPTGTTVTIGSVDLALTVSSLDVVVSLINGCFGGRNAQRRAT